MSAAGSAHILHADLDSFFASVEQRDDPSLRGRPVIVGGGVVLAASYEAKAFGIGSAMSGRRARALCPQAVVVAPRFEAYVQASRAVFAIFEDTTPLVEGMSIDEAFLDVDGLGRLSGTPEQIADRLRQRVRGEVGLAITVGVASSKFLAKVASAVAKPDGLLVVPAGGETAFLHPLPVERLWGVGAVTAAALHARGIVTVGDLAAVEPAWLTAMLGRAAGRHLSALAHNQDPRVVRARPRRRSIGGQRAIGWAEHSDQDIDATLLGLIDRVCRRLRAADRTCRTVVLRLRFADFSRITRSHSLSRPTARTETIARVAQALLAASRPMIHERGATLVGISLANLDDDHNPQLELPFAELPVAALDGTLDRIAERFGTRSITRGALVGRGSGIEMPHLPD